LALTAVNLIVSGAQKNNGLKRGDFQRYRNYCTGKVKKIRKSMGFKYSGPKVKFSSKRIEVERAKDPRVLHALLFNAEKNWAHANEIKSLDNAKLKKTKGSRVKYTIINKLKRSVLWARRLEKLCHEVSEKKSALEAEAYREYLEGMCLFEQ
jgi:signal recognition particle subunit SRP68